MPGSEKPRERTQTTDESSQNLLRASLKYKRGDACHCFGASGVSEVTIVFFGRLSVFGFRFAETKWNKEIGFTVKEIRY